jgi:hypothetical protein
MKHPSLTPDQITILGPAGALEDLVGDDCVIENTNPAPDGARLVGKAACLANWQSLASSSGTWFVREEVLVVGERVVIRWRYCWGDDDTQSIRGINLMRVRGGHIVEAMGYVKG